MLAFFHINRNTKQLVFTNTKKNKILALPHTYTQKRNNRKNKELAFSKIIIKVRIIIFTYKKCKIRTFSQISGSSRC